MESSCVATSDCHDIPCVSVGFASSFEELVIFPVLTKVGKFSALLDTGASTCLIAEHVARRLGDIVESSLTVTGFGKGSVSAVGSLFCEISVGSVLFPVNFLVLNSDVIKPDMILGSDFFHTNGIDVSPHNSKISAMNWNDGSWEIYLNGSDIVTVFRKLPVFSCSDVVVGDEVQCPVSLYYDTTKLTLLDGSCFFFDGTLKPPLHRHFIAESGLMDSKNLQVLLRKFAGADSSYSIKKGQMIGYISSVVDVDVEAPLVFSAGVAGGDKFS